MTTEPDQVADCVCRYAARLHAAIGPGHQVASPLGAWLLLALVGPAAAGPDRVTVTDALGCEPGAAAGFAAALLTRPHPAVACAAAFWTGGSAPTGAPAGRSGPGGSGSGGPGEQLRRWQDGLPPPVSRGPLPDQAGLDDWAREHTFGLIDRFPVRRDPELLLVLATALATRVSWQVPFTTVPASWLGPASRWAGQLHEVLCTPRGRRGHDQFVAVTAEAGDVAVHRAAARDGLAVVSVAAAPDVPAATVLAAAHRIGRQLVTGMPVRRRELSELPLGDGPLGQVREETSAGGPACTAVLPAWSASGQHDLSAPVLGFAAAKDALLPGPQPWQAAQSVQARYSRTGFEAAAVSSVAIAAAARLPATRRVAELRFGHPYAVVALAVDPVPAGGAGQPGPWHGLPVFSAWVSEPEDAAGTGDGVSSLPL